LTNLYENNKDDCDFYIITVNPSVTKKVRKEKTATYNFPHRVIRVFSEADFHKLNDFSCIVTYPGHSNFFGGYLNDNITRMYKIISRCTNELGIPVFIRINDSEIKVRDYRLMCVQRLQMGADAAALGKPVLAFMRDADNVQRARTLTTWKQWDYSKVYWFANGSKEACDWVAETMYDREDPYFKMAPRESFVKNSLYVSDDLFFLVRKNYDRLKNRYEENGKLKARAEPQNKFCYIGFFDTVNMARARALAHFFKQNEQKVPLKIFGKGTEILTKLEGKENVEIEEGFMMGDSDEYFDFLNNHLAYVFIGKGLPIARYIGKTVYDAVVARTPVVVYKKCDVNHITFKSDEFYFENEEELMHIMEKLQDKDLREDWVKRQAEEIFAKLPPTEFNFVNYCTERRTPPEDTEPIFFPTKKTNRIKATSLF
jgi:hypothetical protein